HARIDADPANRWLTETEVAARAATDGRPVSDQVAIVLERFGVWKEQFEGSRSDGDKGEKR
ncbi:MAG: hypothetical protein ACRDD1_10850, partial [Planctomycetia bacterium]